ncbi:hypothetical protein [Brevibacillus parabrevis]|uniref:hypothetical protein n=1 Tax=Brevibacillus parabrevis TaxID=54914 RepID=UPI0012F48ADB|nr:hypothetical protein [Brevibacillus parabrevis]
MRISINILIGRQTSMIDSEFGNDLHHSAWGTTYTRGYLGGGTNESKHGLV